MKKVASHTNIYFRICVDAILWVFSVSVIIIIQSGTLIIG